MQQLLSFWSALDAKRRIIVTGATLIVFLAVLALSRIASTPTMALLYAGMEPSASGDVVAALDQRGARFEVRGDSIWVPSAQRDQLRMALASDGLPASGSAGYELLDQLSGFGTTAQMFDAAYLRAKEGELARTIGTSPYIKSARVHLAVPATQPFRQDLKPSASVTVVSGGGGVSIKNAQAIRHLVAAAVPGMATDDVSVIDSATGLIAQSEGSPGVGSEGRSADMKRSVERLLAARVGQGRALVELSLDLETERESISERRFDPQGRVAISTESENRTNSETGTPPGVTVASNLPEGDAAAGEGSRSQGSESRERVNYEVSETSRELLRSPGGIRRLTVAVLVDGLLAEDGGWQPRSEAELADLNALVASAVGFNAERGDVITIKSLQFETLALGEGSAGPSWFAQLDPMSLIQLAVITLLVLALAFFVIRPLLLSQSRNRIADQSPLPALAPPTDSTLQGGEIEDLDFAGERTASTTDVPQDPVARLRQLIGERQAESVEILRNWMDDREESR